MTAVDLLSTVLNESFASSAWSFADDDGHHDRFHKALNALFEDDEDEEDVSRNSVGPGEAHEALEGRRSATTHQRHDKDEVLAERFMHSISDLLSGNEVLFDSSCQSLSIFDLTTPLTPKTKKKSNKGDASSDATAGKSCSSSVATDTTVSQTSRLTSSSDSNASREFQSSIRNIMNSFSEIMSGGRAFTPDECEHVKKEIVRLRQLRRRMSASDRFGVDFAGFSRSAHRPGTEHGKRRALNLEQQKRQLANIMAWDVEGWKQKALLSNNSATDLSVDGFHDKKELREYIEQKYGMKQVSDLEKSRKSSKPRTSHCPVPLTRIDEDGVKSPSTPRTPRGRITVRTLEQNRRSTSTPRSTQPKSVVDRSVSPSKRTRETPVSGSSPSRRRHQVSTETSSTSKGGTSRDTKSKSPSRHRHGSPSDRSRRPTTPSKRSRRATTPTERSKRTATPTERSKRTTTPTDRSKRTVTPSERSARVLSKDAAAPCRSPSSRRSARTVTKESRTPGRSQRSASPSITPSRRSNRGFDASKSVKRSQSPGRSNVKSAIKLPSVPSLGSHDSVDDSASTPTTPRTPSRKSSTSSPSRPKRTEDEPDRRKAELKEKRTGQNRDVMSSADSPTVPSGDGKGSDLKEMLRRGSGGGTLRSSLHSTRSVGETTPSNRAARSTHLSSLTTHLARTTARRRGRSCARSVHSARSASTTADKSHRSQRSSGRRLSVGASSRSQRLSQKLELTVKSPNDDSQHSRRSLHTKYGKSHDGLGTTEHSESRFDASSTDTSAPKTPQRRSSMVDTLSNGGSTVCTPTTATSTTVGGSNTSSTTTLPTGNGPASPRRRTVRHDLAEIIRGNTVTSSTTVDAGSDSVASPPAGAGAERQGIGIGSSSHHPRSSIKMMLSPQRRTIRDFLKTQSAASPNHGVSEPGCNQTVG